MVHIVSLTLQIVHQHLKQSFMWRKIASFIENHIHVLYWSTSRPKYHDKEEMEKNISIYNVQKQGIYFLWVGLFKKKQKKRNKTKYIQR